MCGTCNSRRSRGSGDCLYGKGRRALKRYSADRETFLLTGEGIDAVSARIDALPESLCARRGRLRIRLAVEEILHHWREALGENASFTFSCGARFGQRSIKLGAAGCRADPTTQGDQTELDAAGSMILERLGLSPAFRYENGVNRVTIPLPRKETGRLARIGIAVALALLLGLISLALPESFRTGLLGGFVTPLFKVLLGTLSGVALPIMFLSVCTSIVGIGDIALLGNIGKRFLRPFLILPFVCTAAGIVLSLWLFPVSLGSGGDMRALEAVFAMLLNIVPTNVLAPFLDGNALQIIFLGVCFGIAFLALGERAQLAAGLTEQFERAVTVMMGALSHLFPLLVFMSIFSLVASRSYSQFGGVALLLALGAVLSLLTILLFTATLCLRLRVQVRTVAQKLLPAFLVALSTASSNAALPLRLEGCEKHLGIEGKVTQFAVPLGQVLFKPAAAVGFATFALCFAKAYGIGMTPDWLILCAMISGILSIATPPVPGGAQVSYSVLFLQLGLPAEGLSLALAAAALWDYISTATSCWCQTVVITLVADELDALDKAVLRAPMHAGKLPTRFTAG